MIALAKPAKRKLTRPVYHGRFLAMLPAIRRTAQIAFRKIEPELRQELIAEVIANTFVAYVRLVERRKTGFDNPVEAGVFVGRSRVRIIHAAERQTRLVVSDSNAAGERPFNHARFEAATLSPLPQHKPKTGQKGRRR